MPLLHTMRRFFSRFRQESSDNDAPHAQRQRPISLLPNEVSASPPQDELQDQSSVSNVEELIPSALHHASTGSGHSPDSTTSVEISQNPHARLRPSYTTISRSVSAQSVPVRHETEAQVPFTGVDSREDQGTTTPVDIGLHNVQITRITASPMPSRPTILSRLGSRFSRRPQDPDPAAASLTHDSDSLHLTRRRLSRLMLRRTIDGSASDSFLSVIESSAHGSSTTPVRSRRRRDLTSISRPIPVHDETLVGTSTADSVSPAPRPLDSSTRRIITSAPPRPEHRHTRLSRLRHSMTLPFDNILLGRSPSSTLPEMQISPPRPAREPQSTASNFMLSADTDPSIDLTQSASNEVVAPMGNIETRLLSTPAQNAERPSARGENPSWTERLVDRAAAGRREARRVPNMLRGRSSRLIRRDDEAPLPRILQLAAATIAAQLLGNSDQAPSNIQAFGGDGIEGNINNMFQSLQSATNATHLNDNDAASNDGSPNGSTLPPMNFLRVFRFFSNHDRSVNTAAGTGQNPSTQSEDGPGAITDASDGADGRTVTLVMVGVRSVPSDHTGEDAIAAEPNLDAFLRLPHAMTNNLLRTTAGGLLRHADGRSRIPRRRRASMGGVNAFPANYDSQRHQRLPSSNRHSSIVVPSAVASAVPSTPAESPPGPHPPPSTPADPYLSGSTTPNRRPSSASALQHPPLPSREITAQHLRDAGIPVPNDPSAQGVHQRRRSDSEFARQRDFGAGSARRNGVVEPDTTNTSDARTTGSRSWLIYVIGTNLSEDHPALTTPTLFTDVSLYPHPCEICLS